MKTLIPDVLHRLGLALCLTSFARDSSSRAKEMSDKSEKNSACQFYYTVEFKGYVTEHGRNMALKWFAKSGAKDYPAVCFTVTPKATYVITLSGGEEAQSFRIGAKNVTSTNSSPLSGTVTDTQTGQVVTIRGDITTTTTSTVPVVTETDSQVVYGYVNGDSCGTTQWSATNGAGLGVVLIEKGINDRLLHKLFNSCLELTALKEHSRIVKSAQRAVQ